jgi:hypothetical protein
MQRRELLSMGTAPSGGRRRRAVLVCSEPAQKINA